MNFRKAVIFLLLALWLFRSASPVLAENKYGIHISELSDLEKSAELVNSNGGDWGYVTIVLRDDDLKQDKWQKFFDSCRKLHLIPIVRIATHMAAGYWEKPNPDDLNKWPEFLNSLNWPVKQQIVVVFNEPNHAKEWGGEINPREYSLILEKMISLFKNKNQNFYILNAGLDQAADGRNGTMDEAVFIKEMAAASPDVFNHLDGWASHSYPNHGFVGLPENTGRASIRGYEWELGVLQNNNTLKNLDIYITETGWPHKEGMTFDRRFYEHTKVAQLFEKAFNIWAKDNRVKTVTPFILNYPEEPFDHFSFFAKDGQYYASFNAIKELVKTSSNPEQIEKFTIKNFEFSNILPTNYSAKAKLIIKNTGQWIMGERKPFSLILEIDKAKIDFDDIILSENALLEPGQEVALELKYKTGTQSAETKFAIGDQEYTIYIYKPFDLKNKKVSLWQQITNRMKLWWMDFSD